MAISLRANKMIPLLVVVFLVVAGLVIVKANKQPPLPPDPLKKVPTPISADADTPQDTVRTLTSEVRGSRADMAKITKQNDELKQKNAELTRDFQTLQESVTNRVVERLNRSDSPVGVANNGALSNRLEQLEAQISRYAGQPPSSSSPNGIPDGLGYDGVSTGGASPASRSVADPNQLVWTDPVAFRKSAPGAPTAKATPVSYSDPLDGPLPQSVAEGRQQPAAPAKKEAIPYFTIPENATLTGATAMSALVGRIPVKGKIEDAVPFKVIVGRPNLAANGFEVPDDIVGMVMTGIARGDWTLACVYGDIESVTFIFQDGTIQTVSNRHPNGAEGGGNGIGAGSSLTGVANANRIGWISDERGFPCLSGDRITNAPGYLSGLIGLRAAQAAAEAAAASQTTINTTPLGGTTGSVTGDQSKYILGKAASGSVDEIAKWVTDRLQSSFDAVYVRAGVSVALHLDRAVLLDKLPNARQLDYHRRNTAAALPYSSSARSAID